MKVYCWINRQADKLGVKFKKQTQHQTRQERKKLLPFLFFCWFASRIFLCVIRWLLFYIQQFKVLINYLCRANPYNTLSFNASIFWWFLMNRWAWDIYEGRQLSVLLFKWLLLLKWLLKTDVWITTSVLRLFLLQKHLDRCFFIRSQLDIKYLVKKVQNWWKRCKI